MKMNLLKRTIIKYIQKYNRRLNTAYLENFYQINYLDMARRTDWLKVIPLSSPSGGTASFSLLYILLMILSDRNNSKLMEIGVGQSTKLLMQYAEEFNDELVLLDDNQYWLNTVVGENTVATSIYSELVSKTVCNHDIRWYKVSPPNFRFDFLLIDGPMAYTKDMKYNRLGVLDWIPDILDDDFIIIVDDSGRTGESLLVQKLMNKLKHFNISIKSKEIVGANTQTIIATSKYYKYLYL